MLRRIVVVRHAKSDWAAGAETDHQRPLNDRGRREAPETARLVRQKGWAPAVVLSSDATRTRETWACMATELPAPARVEYFASLYHAGREAAVEALGLADDLATSGVVMLVGHNPGWEEMVSDVSGQSITMKTAYAALLEADAETFAAALSGHMKLVELVRPRE
jgi:phosphohistidine phosphatase